MRFKGGEGGERGLKGGEGGGGRGLNPPLVKSQRPALSAPASKR